MFGSPSKTERIDKKMPMPNEARHPLVERVTAEPILVNPDRVGVFGSSLSYLAANAAELLDEPAASCDRDFWGEPGMEHPYRPYVVANGILQIPVQGVLLNRFSYAYGRWATGYQYIEKALVRGLADENVRGIALIVDSPGGEVAGCFELSDKIFEARRRKPIRAFAADHAYSAAYALASSASDLVVTRSGGTGSVGVVTAHVDYSAMLEDAGIKVTFIFAGAHKVDGNAYEPLPDSVKGRIQERIDRIYGVFTSTVARNRSVEEKVVRDTEALTFDAQDSVARGFADRIGAMDEEMVIFSTEVAETEDEDMPNETPSASASEGHFTQAQVDAATAAARAEGATAARARIRAILDSDEGKARPKAALSLALKSDIALDDAKAILSDMPEEKAEAAPTSGWPQMSAFERAMLMTQNPEVGADAGTQGQPEMSVPDRVFASVGIPAAPHRQ